MPKRQRPILAFSMLTAHVYVVTRYKVIDAEKQVIEAKEKWDVTELFELVRGRVTVRHEVPNQYTMKQEPD